MQARTKLKTGDRQAELLQAALRLAAARSPAEITTGDLAQAIGITQGGVFKHFESKQAIWLAVIGGVHQTLMAQLQHAAQASGGDALQALRSVFMAHIDFVVQHPGVPRLIFQELQHTRDTPLKAKVQVLMADYRALLADLLAQAQAAGLVAPTVDLKGAVVLFIGAVQGLVMQALISGNLPEMRQQAVVVFDLVEAGLRASPHPEQRKRK